MKGHPFIIYSIEVFTVNETSLKQEAANNRLYNRGKQDDSNEDTHTHDKHELSNLVVILTRKIDFNTEF